MTIWKKAVSAATSAALLASLLATAVAPSAFAAITVASAGNVPVNGTSANTATFTFTEASKNSIATDAAGSFTVTITPAAPGAGAVTFSGTASVATSTGSLGASAVAAGNVLTISIKGSDLNNIESIIVTGLKIKAAVGTSTGAIVATMSAGSGSLTSPAGIFSGGGTASGFLATGVSVGALSAVVNVTTTACSFVNTGTDVDPGPGVLNSGKYAFAAGVAGTTAESVEGTTTALPAAPAAQQQTFTITVPVGGFTSAHNAGDVVTQTNACFGSSTIASPGTVVAALAYSSADNATVFPGESNSVASDLKLIEPSAGFLAKDSTVTYKITTAGVVFSTAPTKNVTVGDLGLSAPVISADRLSATVTVTGASTVASTWLLQGIKYDVGASVAPGTFISVEVSTSAGKAVQPVSNTNAVVFRGVVAVSATSPTVYIGENNQAAGIVTFTESAAGFFTAGIGTNVNTFEICPSGVGYSFTLAPYAQVVGGVAAGNLILRDGNAASTTNLVQGKNLGDGCYGWTIWTASTTASSIKIGNADLTTGALINVTPGQQPGGVNVALKIGSSDFVNPTLAATVQFATAVYRNQVAVTALSQPLIAPGATNAPAGNLQIAETSLGQLKADEVICFEILWRSGELQDQFLNNLNTADLPVATASGTGLVVGPVNSSKETCGNTPGTVPKGYAQSFTFKILQQSTKGDGKIVISGIRYTALTDTADGPVQLSVWGEGKTPTEVFFHSTVSNATIGVAAPLPTLKINATSALGNNPTSGYTTKTPKVQVVGKYITWKFTGGTALAGQRVNVLVAQRINGAWGGPKYFVSRTADANGIVTFIWKSNSALVVNARVQWPGSASFAVSTSPALGAHWQ